MGGGIDLTQILASRLRAMGVVSDRGLQIGRLVDITFDEKEGRMVSLIVRPMSGGTLTGIARDSSGNILIPYSAVMSIRDYLVINERVLAIQQLKSQPAGSPPEG